MLLRRRWSDERIRSKKRSRSRQTRKRSDAAAELHAAAPSPSPAAPVHLQACSIPPARDLSDEGRRQRKLQLGDEQSA